MFFVEVELVMAIGWPIWFAPVFATCTPWLPLS